MDTLLEKKLELSYEFLDENFYKGFRNEVTEKRLDELATLAKEIGEHDVYGLYPNPIDYLKALKITLGSTLETRHRSIFLWEKVLPFIKAKVNFLDVGSGDGKITRWVGRNFERVAVIDTNPIVINALPFILGNRIKFSSVCESILDTPLKNDHYDLALLSHTLYYIEKTKWLNLITKIYKSTKPGGVVAIILGGDTFGKAELIKYFGGKAPDIDWLFQRCHQLFPKEKILGFHSKEAFISKNILEMLHISGFMLYDAGVTASEEALKEYINKHFKLENNGFCMTTQQKFILIFKS
jgi:2-polyprenyl-3-methyl-5-hydroxy-6-metoxy-1,4-benzoquinol methylase